MTETPDEPTSVGPGAADETVIVPPTTQTPAHAWSAEPSAAAPAPLPGWYPDPHGRGGQRYFDGYTWTEHMVSPLPAEEPTRRGLRWSDKAAIVGAVAWIPLMLLMRYTPDPIAFCLAALWLACWIAVAYGVIDAVRRALRALIERSRAR